MKIELTGTKAQATKGGTIKSISELKHGKDAYTYEVGTGILPNRFEVYMLKNGKIVEHMTVKFANAIYDPVFAVERYVNHMKRKEKTHEQS